MDPKTGEILAMVNKPDFDPNNPYDGIENFVGETDEEKIPYDENSFNFNKIHYNKF